MFFLFWGILSRGMIERIFFAVFQNGDACCWKIVGYSWTFDSIRTWFYGRLSKGWKIIMKSLPSGLKSLFSYLFVPIPIPTGTTITLTTHVMSFVPCTCYNPSYCWWLKSCTKLDRGKISDDLQGFSTITGGFFPDFWTINSSTYTANIHYTGCFIGILMMVYYNPYIMIGNPSLIKAYGGMTPSTPPPGTERLVTELVGWQTRIWDSAGFFFAAKVAG